MKRQKKNELYTTACINLFGFYLLYFNLNMGISHMISLQILIGILFTHFVGDFVLQSRWMAENKSSYIKPLLIHACIYGLCFLWLGPLFAIITLVAHCITDFGTSRVAKTLWPSNRYGFFCVIGFDQMLHYGQLLLTYHLLG